MEYDWKFVNKLSNNLQATSKALEEFSRKIAAVDKIVSLKSRQWGSSFIVTGTYGANIYNKTLEDLQVEYLLNGYEGEI